VFICSSEKEFLCEKRDVSIYTVPSTTSTMILCVFYLPRASLFILCYSTTMLVN